MILKTIKKISLRVGFVLLFSTTLLNTSLGVDFFINSDKPNNGKIINFFRCDNNLMIKIIHLGGNKYQFYSVGGNNIMERKTPYEVAAFVCKYYLKSH
ncbi:MAG: hypothetical protein HOD92_12955 [Deltaproteobacteria bacterium]|jgi:hypothetical protein|nr:hypothetical protein [Deltaproteobacteria bacterium]MBT4527864.1 hypothetical protein [Deltaproteobacteria bacterium]